MNSHKSFTLIELLVVIATVGILAGIIIVSMTGATDQATLAKAKVFSISMRDSMSQSLVSEWKFDGSGVSDGSDATAPYVKDTWGNNNGTIYGNPLVKSGSNCVSGSCLSFDGVDDYIDVGNASSLAITDAITMEFWAYRVGTSSNGSCSEIISRRGCYDVCCQNLYSNVDGHADVALVLGVIPKIRTWYHLVYTYDSSTKIGRFYSNGKLQSTRDVSSFYPGYTNYKMGSTCGNLNISNGNYRWNGLLDEIRLYSTAIPIAQIQSNYDAGLKSLLANKGITEEEYNQRIAELESSQSKK